MSLYYIDGCSGESNFGGGGSGANTCEVFYFTSNTGTELDITDTYEDFEFADSVFVYRNGLLLKENIDYTKNSQNKILTFTIALKVTDAITVVNGNIDGLDMSNYLTKMETQTIKNKIISADDNDIEDLQVENFKDEKVVMDVRTLENAKDDCIATEKAIRKAIDNAIDNLEQSVNNSLSAKQQTLIAGNGILISGNTISTTGESSGGGNVVWFDKDNGFSAGDIEIQTQMQTIHKVFLNGLLLRQSKDYTTTVVGGVIKIIFTNELKVTDEVAVE